jgi:hypothetical protein
MVAYTVSSGCDARIPGLRCNEAASSAAAHPVVIRLLGEIATKRLIHP